MKLKTKLKYIFIGLIIILLDLMVYLYLFAQLVQYDDNYNESKGKYWGPESMTGPERFASVGFSVWNIINLLLIVFIIFKLIKKRKNVPQQRV
jgi:hypothetical protein